MKVNKNIFVYTLLGCLLAASQLFAQEQYQDYFKVKAIPDTTQIRIGEPIKVELTARVMIYALKGANLKVVFPNLPDSLNHIEIIERTQLDTTGSNEQQKLFK